MPFIGQQPTTGTFVELDSLTASATADYTLQLNGANYEPESVNNLLVSINGVIQGSSTMSLSGSTLTVGATLSSSDVIDFVRVFGNVGTISTPTDGSVTANKIGTGAVDLTTKVTGVLPVANSQTNTPAFQARRSTGFQFSDNTDTKVTGFTEDFDTDNNFASDRFTPTTAGKYFVTIQGSIQGVSNYDMYNANINLRKNGTELLRTSSQGNASSRSNRYGLSLSLIVDMNGTSDYLEMYVYLNNVGSDDGTFNADTLSFGAYKLIGA
mgnify:CR=1 FL=1